MIFDEKEPATEFGHFSSDIVEEYNPGLVVIAELQKELGEVLSSLNNARSNFEDSWNECDKQLKETIQGMKDHPYINELNQYFGNTELRPAYRIDVQSPGFIVKLDADMKALEASLTALFAEAAEPHLKK